ncbi:MAG: radical SAM protein [Candidatus Woesearchaeota archaeon]|jgi:hypothetical protein
MGATTQRNIIGDTYNLPFELKITFKLLEVSRKMMEYECPDKKFEFEAQNALILEKKETYCHACGFEWDANRFLTYGQTQLIFNADADLVGAISSYQDPTMIFFQRGFVNGFTGAGNCYTGMSVDNKLESIAEKISMAYIFEELKSKDIEVLLDEINLEMKDVLKVNPTHKIVKSFFDGKTKEKQKMLKDITDYFPLILPPDVAQTAYNFLTIVAERGCGNDCMGCGFKSNLDYQNDESEIDNQIRFYLENYPESSQKYKGLVVGGENPLKLRTDLLLYILNKAKGSFPELGAKPVGVVALPFEKDSGFAYSFSTFSSLAKKSNQELLELQDAGMRCINLGLESGSERVLHKYFPKQSIKSMEEGLQRLAYLNVTHSINVILGKEEDEVEHVESTQRFLEKIGYSGRIFVSRYKNIDGSYAMSKTDFLQHAKLFLDINEARNSIKVYPVLKY